MTIEIPFDKSLSKEQAWVMFNDIWSKNVRLNNYRIYYAIGFFVAGYIILQGKSNTGLIFIAAGIYFLVKYIEYYQFYTKNKERFTLEIEKVLNKYEANNTSSFWEFNDVFLGYKDAYFDIKINWEMIPSYKIIDDLIIMKVSQGNHLGYAISRKEVPSETFDVIEDIVKSKIASKL